MITPVNNNFSPMPFYEVSGNELDNKYLQSNQPYAYGAVFDMPIEGGWLMPFQFTVDFEVSSISSCDVIPIGNAGASESYTTLPIAVVDQETGNTTVIHAGEQHSKLPVGRMYVRIVLVETVSGSSVNHVYMSDIFTNIREATNNQHVIPEGYIRLTYTNDHPLVYNGGSIYFQDHKFGFDILIDATIAKPIYTFEEKSSDRLGYKYIEQQISNKQYGFTFVAPEYLCDALRFLPMCNQRTIADRLHSYNKITDVSIEVDWLEQGDLAQVTILFNNDTVIANLAEYVSVAPRRLNTTLPTPPTPEINKPTVLINNIVDLQPTEAVVSAEVAGDGGSPITERGMCWSATNSTPTLSDSYVANALAEVGQFNQQITGLTSGTTYYVRAYATNSLGTSYSDTLSIEMPLPETPPTVLTYAAGDVTSNSADVSGSVIDEGSKPVTQRGIAYSTTDTVPDINSSDTNTWLQGDGGIGSYLFEMRGLTPNTTYYYRAFAISAVGVAYGETMSFTTLNESVIPPQVRTNSPATNITAGGARVTGDFISYGTGTISQFGFCISAFNNQPTINDTVVQGNSAGMPESFYANLSGLMANTTYYYRAFATNEGGTGYGDTFSFTTTNNADAPDVQFDQYGVVSSSRIRLDASVTDDNGAAVTEMGFVYSSSVSMPNYNNASHVVAGQVSGYSFGDYIDNLQPSTTYYCRAYAINSAGIGYSGVIALTTQAAPINVPTVTVEQIETPSPLARNVIFDAEVTANGGDTVMQRGICWSGSNPVPTISDNNIAAPAGGVGTYQVATSVTNFSNGRTYYYRAYAINSAGVGYSGVKSFTMPVPAQEEDER